MFRTSPMWYTCIVLALTGMLAVNGSFLPETTSSTFAQSDEMSITVRGPAYVNPGSDITYVLTVKNLTSQPITDIGVFSALPTSTTYISGGNFIPGDNGVEFDLFDLAAGASQKLTWVVNVDSGVALGTYIDSDDNQIYTYTIGGQPGGLTYAAGGLRTTVEAPGTLVAVYKNSSGRAFDVSVDGFQFENYGGDSSNTSDDLGADDMFNLFGVDACHAGTTADTCVLTGPAETWRKAQVADMAIGHCDGMAATSLHIFDRLPFKGLTTPGDIQSGAAQTFDLTFPDQTLENYIAGMMIFQYVDEYYDEEIIAGPVEIVNKLTADFNKAEPVPYVLGIFKVPGFKDGHAITAYGIETVNANESRILVYDNNFPNQRKYITVDMAANTWRYETAAIPGNPPDVYTGGATSGNLSIVPNGFRTLSPGEHVACPFCSETVNGAGMQLAAGDMVMGELTTQFAGEGAILIVNDEGQKTGDDPDTQTFVDEIPGTTVIHSRGGLGKEAPPRIIVPFSETDDTFYKVIVHGETVSSTTAGSLTMSGPGFAIGVRNVNLDPQEQFEFMISPDGDHISFNATEDIAAPEIFISHDPVNDGDPSVIFDIKGVTLRAGEKVSLDLDPVLERMHFDHTGPEEEVIRVEMKLIWPDGEVKDYIETIDLPAGSTSAFIDFGAWDGLLHPATYFDGVLQNPSVNHRLKLASSTDSYDPTPQANAPAGVYSVAATFTNVTEVSLEDVSFTVADLAAGNLLLNADGGPAGVGATISVPAAALGSDGILHPNESFTYSFAVGLASAGASDLTVDANGVPHDWILPDPVPSYDANDASFVFAVNSSNNPIRLFLPLLVK